MKDRIYKDEVRVEYFPTNLMLVDNFAKPLMEKVFKELGGTVMGYKSIPKPDPTILISIKESVGNHLKSSD